MTALVQAALRVRRTARSAWGLAAAFLLAAFLLAGFFVPGSRELGWLHLSWVVAWIALFGHRTHNAYRQGADPRSAFELGVLLLVGVQALVQFRGGIGSDLYPLTFVAVALVASFAVGLAGIGVVVFALALGLATAFFGEQISDPLLLGVNALFIVCFGALSHLFTRAEIVRVRRKSDLELAAQKEKVKDDTRLFRLVAPSSDRVRDEERLYETSVQEVRQALYHALQLLHRTLDLHTCVLLMPSDEAEQLCIAELVTNSDDVADGPFALGAGAVGAAVRRKVTASLQQIRPGYGGICYYRGPASVRSFIAVPVLERGHLRAVLCADRVIDRAFGPEEEELLRDSTSHILRAFENERVFVQLESAKREQETLYRVSQALSTALTQDVVMELGLTAAKEIAPHDFAAITEYQPEGRRHVVRRAAGERALDFQGLRFRDNASLTAMVVKNRHYLPYRGEFDSKQQVLFTKKAKLKAMESLLVLPLVACEEPIGTLIVAAKASGAFGTSVRETLQALANQLAVAMANARSVRLLEELATTDGLTGCLNKRALLDHMEQKLMAAQRFGRKLSLIVTDLDHFKAVNDTYGHAAGDRVLKELGEVLRRVKRETDIVARFGGEEFCVLCEETDLRGAQLLAERVREELEKTEVLTELGPLKVTASLGVATFPDHASTAADLFVQGDKALYEAKHRGRNQVCTV
ncbi:MAG: diguanylate cyclase [Deltaproteobacteria bacterium]|nr:diguanylate cyclase [Deltaproteobacteria bacterium]MBW2547567.1 diguanylate cyclase [Deltaproteobacteria bacterium]RLB52135.1 MAG: diguanylate cyclase [Deltaproteobacteria bacterium]